MPILRLNRYLLVAAAPVTFLGLLACSGDPVGNVIGNAPGVPSSQVSVTCTASVTTKAVTCGAPNGGMMAVRGSDMVVGGQHTYVQLTSSNVSYNSTTEIMQFDVTVQNLLNEALGSPDGVTADTGGVKVFFATGPVATSGTGTLSVANADGVETFTNTNQPFFRYSQVLHKNDVSAAKTWQLNVPSTVSTFSFTLYVSTSVQPLLVINELLSNPGGTISDVNGEWIELYNAGTLAVDLQGLFIVDSAASGRRPYAMINDPARSLVVASGGYFVLGDTPNMTNNGGVPVDYAYGATMAFANSLDAFKLSRVYGTDTLTIDRTQYAAAAISAQNGISRELKNPALDNSNMDGSNWADAMVTAVYGPGGRGTPKAQNSSFTP